jgi:hypothetical protein
MKLCPELQKTIVTYIATGNYIETACAGAGISKFSLYNWLKRGKNQDRGTFRDFSNAVEQALAKSEMIDVGIITRAALAGDWRAASWRLEHKNQNRWGPGVLKVQNHPPEEEEARQMSDDELLASMKEVLVSTELRIYGK